MGSEYFSLKTKKCCQNILTAATLKFWTTSGVKHSCPIEGICPRQIGNIEAIIIKKHIFLGNLLRNYTMSNSEWELCIYIQSNLDK